DDFAAEHGGNEQAAHEAQGVEHGDDAEEDGFFVEVGVFAGVLGVGFEVAVGEHDALGHAGGARSVHDDGNVIGVSGGEGLEIFAEIFGVHGDGGHGGDAGLVECERFHIDDFDTGPPHGGDDGIREGLEKFDGEDDFYAG